MDPRRVVMTPHELLDAARDLMQRPDAPFDGIWPRAAALLARQALEAAMAERAQRAGIRAQARDQREAQQGPGKVI